MQHPSARSPRLRRALVTGVEQAEGAHAARVLAAHGFHVIAHSFAVTRAENTARDITLAGGYATAVVADLTLDREVDRLFTGIEHDHGDLDAVVHAAWFPGPETTIGSLDTVAPSDWSRFALTHLALVFLTLTRAARSMRTQPRGGAIITLTGPGRSPSDTATDGSAMPAREAINGAVEAFTVAAAHDIGTEAVRLNAIRIGPRAAYDGDETYGTLDDFDALLTRIVDIDNHGGSGRVLPASLRIPIR